MRTETQAVSTAREGNKLLQVKWWEIYLGGVLTEEDNIADAWVLIFREFRSGIRTNIWQGMARSVKDLLVPRGTEAKSAALGFLNLRP